MTAAVTRRLALTVRLSAGCSNACWNRSTGGIEEVGQGLFAPSFALLPLPALLLTIIELRLYRARPYLLLVSHANARLCAA